MTWKHKFTVFGWVSTEVYITLGTIETNKSLRDIWDILYLTFVNDYCSEGIFVKEEK